jgi:hypothetical protein
MLHKDPQLEECDFGRAIKAKGQCRITKRSDPDDETLMASIPLIIAAFISPTSYD